MPCICAETQHRMLCQQLIKDTQQKKLCIFIEHFHIVICINNYPYIGGSSVLKKHQDSNPTPQGQLQTTIKSETNCKLVQNLRQVKIFKVTQLQNCTIKQSDIFKVNPKTF